MNLKDQRFYVFTFNEYGNQDYTVRETNNWEVVNSILDSLPRKPGAIGLGVWEPKFNNFTWIVNDDVREVHEDEINKRKENLS